VVHGEAPVQRSAKEEMTTLTTKITDIKIGNRFRKEMGDIDSLVKTIQDVGLLQPIGVNEDNELVYGARRLEACKRLGWTEIPVNIIPLSDIIKGEFIENSAREDFTFSERQAILKEIEKQRLGHKVSKEKVSNLLTFQQDNKGKPSVDIVSEYTGVSPRQLSKEKKIVQAVEQKPELEHVIEELDSGEISVNEADKKIRFHEYFDTEEKKKGKWRKLREEVLKGDSYRCRKCSDMLHLDVYTIDSFHDKDKLENLETLCRDCHELKMKFDKVGLAGSFVWIFQELTGMSGRRYFQYSIGQLDSNQGSSSSFIEEMQKNPYSKLKRSSYDELVSKTREHRKEVIKSLPLGDHDVYLTQDVLSQLLPILRDYQEMIDKEAEARRRKDKLSKP
jgi:ParB-like chromosome segregation protein Spo0J